MLVMPAPIGQQELSCRAAPVRDNLEGVTECTSLGWSGWYVGYAQSCPVAVQADREQGIRCSQALRRSPDLATALDSLLHAPASVCCCIGQR